MQEEGGLLEHNVIYIMTDHTSTQAGPEWQRVDLILFQQEKPKTAL
jgi:hypothetical protein